MKDGLTTFQREAIREVLAEFPEVERAVLFGSRAMGTWSPASDVDLALFGDSLTLEDEARIAARMEDLGLPVTVDLVRHATIQSEALKGHILRCGRVFYEGAAAESVCTSALAKGPAGAWPSVPFVSLLDGGTKNGIYKPKQFHGRGARIINMGELFAYPRLRSVEMRRVDVNSSELARFSVSSGDLLFARRSLVAAGAGKCSIVLEANEPTVFESSIIRARPRPEIANSAFLFYLFRSPLGVHKLDSILRHVAVAGITGKDLEALELPCPPISEQRAIARILGTLDDKIELNRKMNETLEAMARAIFQSWFVKFDPVHAKARGEQPAGMSDNIAALFPSEFEDSELGPIPKGWAARPVLSIAKLVGGGTPKTDRPEYWDGMIPWASAKDVSQCGSLFLTSTERAITELGRDRSSTKMIPAFSTVIVARGATTGRMAVFGREMAMNQTCYALVSFTKTPFALFCLLKAAVSGLVHAAHGSVFDTITTSTFTGKPVVVPPVELLLTLERKVDPLFRRLLSGTMENETLTALRDALLPRLISGRLRVPEAERLVGDAIK